MPGHLLQLIAAASVAALVMLTVPSVGAGPVQADTPVTGPNSILANNILVSWYGNPNDPRMGALGQYSGEELAAKVRKQANGYAGLSNKGVLPAYELVAVVAQATAGEDGKWRRKETKEMIDSLLQQARQNGFKLILDVQVGHSTVQDELPYLRPWLEEPEVYLALDPEFDMWDEQIPGIAFGHTRSEEVNFAINYLDSIVRARNLPPKVLIVHQFTLSMLPDKENISSSPVVDVALVVDGFDSRALKLDSYRSIMDQKQLEYSGIKLFYDQDTELFAPADALQIDPIPSVVIYQ